MGKKISWWYDGIIFLHGIYTIRNKMETVFSASQQTGSVLQGDREGILQRYAINSIFSFCLKKKKNKQQAKGKRQKMTEEGKSSSEGKIQLTFSAASSLYYLNLQIWVGFFFILRVRVVSCSSSLLTQFDILEKLLSPCYVVHYCASS